jgi:hypothetical protein
MIDDAEDALVGKQLRHRRIQRWSAAMAIACLLAPPLLVGGAIYHGVTVPAGQLAQSLALPHVDLDGGRRAGVIVAFALPTIAIAIGLWRLRSAFQHFAKGDFFSVAAIQALRSFALCALVSTVIAILATPITGVLLTVGLGRRASMPILVGSDQLMMLLVASAVWIFARVMSQAAELRQRNEHLERENAAYV